MFRARIFRKGQSACSTNCTNVYIHRPLYYTHLLNCFTQLSYQQITWQQFSTFRHADMDKTICCTEQGNIVK